MDSKKKNGWIAGCILLLVVTAGSCKHTAVLVEARGPEGATAFRRSQQTTTTLDHFHVVMTRTTPVGEFTVTQALDCSVPYFYEHEVLERSQKAMDEGGSLSQGRPSAHQEHDTLYIDGKTYRRNTSSWENASRDDDAHPDWYVGSIPRDPHEACTSIKAGAEFGYVLYAKILTTNNIQYLGKQSVNGHDCFEYQAAFPGQKESDEMTTVNEGGGNFYSFRTMVNTTIYSRVCLGVQDHLPYRVVSHDYVATYDFSAVEKSPAPGSSQ